MSYLLNLVYVALLLICSPWLLWQAVTKRKYREGWGVKLLGLAPVRGGNRPCVWLHGVSVGEVNLLATLIEELARKQPTWQCVVSTTTMTGYAVALRKYPQCAVFYCPLDLSWAVRRAMRRVRPTLLVLAELELWPNLVLAAREHGARVAVINGRLSEKSLAGYQRIKPLVAWLLRQIDLVAVQDELYAQRFLALGAVAERLHVTGSMKYDGAATERDNPRTRRLAELAGFVAGDTVLLAGSTQQGEEAAALAAWQSLAPDYPNLRLVLVPRHPERFDEVGQLLERSGVRWQCRSRLEREGVDKAARVLLVDAVGELGAWWGAAHIGFVGGSLNQRGGQNMIEPAAYGVATCFGPHTHNFRDVVSALLGAEAAVVVADASELKRFVERCLREPQWAAAIGRRGAAFVRTQLGATARTVELLERMVSADAPRQPRRAA